MSGRLYLIDSNILIRWVQSAHSDFPAVERAIQTIEDRGDHLCYTSQNLGEFWNVMTRPKDRNGFGLPAEDALIRAELIEAKFRLLPDSPSIHEEWRRLLITYRVCGVQVHDARLVAAMIVHGVKRILTFNTRDFARFQQIEAVPPNQLPAQ